ncbi:hypothetical protein ACODYM_18850 [Burkholderia gladioli]|uniref:hypothetical protein n=1 Tax=Burkholderia gladioli TaxID=28095 RepID=UPI003B504344
MSIVIFSCFSTAFYRQGSGDLLMPGKPRKTSFPEKIFTVKDGKSLNSERECLNPASIRTATFIVSFFCWLAIAADRCRDVFSSKSIRYVSFSIAGDSPRRT